MPEIGSRTIEGISRREFTSIAGIALNIETMRTLPSVFHGSTRENVVCKRLVTLTTAIIFAISMPLSVRMTGPIKFIAEKNQPIKATIAAKRVMLMIRRYRF